MTDAEFLAWADSPGAMRCVLVEVGVRSSGTEVTRYLSSRDYVTGAADTPANTAYLPVLSGAVTITERLGLSGSASMSFGDVEIINTGDLDGWLSDVWAGRSIKVYVGDVTWPRANFRQVWDGTVDDLGSRDRNTLNLKLRDKLQRLNSPVSDVKLGGSTDNKDRLKPICLGECHNVEPLLINPGTLTYQLHNGAIERVIEVRDNGVPVAPTATLTTGTFTLSSQPFGVVTASVQGLKPAGTYRNTIGALVQHVVTNYGRAADRFTTGDIDSANFTAFETANPQPVGAYLADKTNVLQVCSDLAASVGAQLVMSRTGQLRLLRVELPAPGTPTAIGPDDMELRSLRIVSRPPVQAAVKLGYARNWTVQTGLQTGIPEAHKSLYAQEWLTVTATDSTVAGIYKLDVEVDQQDTALLVESDASAEATRRLNLWKVPRTVFGFRGLPQLMLQTLGSAVTLQHSRFGLASGVSGQVVGITQDWARMRVDMEVLV